ncbi:MAG: helicase HerA-like domain-containing protein [Pirellulaceae bacterium]
MGKIYVGRSSGGAEASIPLNLINRHGVITGATGVGKSRTTQSMIEQLSDAGVPSFCADVKSDMSGVGSPGDEAGEVADRARAMGLAWKPRRFPVQYWDLFGGAGLPIRTSVQDMGALMLSRMLGLNPTQEGAMEICFRKAEQDQNWLLTLDDLRWALTALLENREEICREFGHVTSASIAAIQRNILALEAQGGDKLFGEPPFDILDFMRVEDGRGVVNLLHADRLMEAPKLYATFLLWLLTELFRRLPEAGDLDKPKLVFFFDEAHLLFRDAPKPLVQQIERLVRLVRSKGVGVFFVTQAPSDVPDAVLAQLGNRIQHALRAYTPAAHRMIRAAADALRPNPAVDARKEITVLGIGEALVSVMEAENVPGMVEKVKIIPPQAQIGPVSDMERRALIEASPLYAKYHSAMEPHQAVQSFVGRMRAKRGLPALEPVAEPWQEGDYLKYVPYQVGVEARVGGSVARQLMSIALWGAVAVGCFSLVA